MGKDLVTPTRPLELVQRTGSRDGLGKSLIGQGDFMLANPEFLFLQFLALLQVGGHGQAYQLIVPDTINRLLLLDHFALGLFRVTVQYGDIVSDGLGKLDEEIFHVQLVQRL